jgi:uncharacterized protein (DUF2147 family)
MVAAASPALANDLSGVWLRENGEARVKFDACGDAMCGTIVWIKPGVDTPAKIGQRVFYELKPSGANAWSGKAFEPASGSEYSGKLSVDGKNLSTAGCVLGGLICKTVNWTKVP